MKSSTQSISVASSSEVGLWCDPRVRLFSRNCNADISLFSSQARHDHIWKLLTWTISALARGRFLDMRRDDRRSVLWQQISFTKQTTPMSMRGIVHYITRERRCAAHRSCAPHYITKSVFRGPAFGEPLSLASPPRRNEGLHCSLCRPQKSICFFANLVFENMLGFCFCCWPC